MTKNTTFALINERLFAVVDTYDKNAPLLRAVDVKTPDAVKYFTYGVSNKRLFGISDKRLLQVNKRMFVCIK